jgi:hypothetical protein
MRGGERVKLKEQHVTARLQLNASAGRHDGVGILLQYEDREGGATINHRARTYRWFGAAFTILLSTTLVTTNTTTSIVPPPGLHVSPSSALASSHLFLTFTSPCFLAFPLLPVQFNSSLSSCSCSSSSSFLPFFLLPHSYTLVWL